MDSHLKSAAYALSLIALLVGFAACAKYPVISQTPGQSPSAHAPSPTPAR